MRGCAGKFGGYDVARSAERPGAPVAELVDAADSKSVARKGVLVRVRPGAPIQSIKPLSARHASYLGMGANWPSSMFTNRLKVSSLQVSALGRQADVTDGWRHFRYVPRGDILQISGHPGGDHLNGTYVPVKAPPQHHERTHIRQAQWLRVRAQFRHSYSAPDCEDRQALAIAATWR